MVRSMQACICVCMHTIHYLILLVDGRLSFRPCESLTPTVRAGGTCRRVAMNATHDWAVSYIVHCVCLVPCAL